MLRGSSRPIKYVLRFGRVEVVKGGNGPATRSDQFQVMFRWTFGGGAAILRVLRNSNPAMGSKLSKWAC